MLRIDEVEHPHATKILKLSNKGYTFHTRLLVLSHDILCYYRKCPESFSRDNQFVAPECNPKRTVKLSKITVGKIKEFELTKFPKLKHHPSPSTLFKISFKKSSYIGRKIKLKDSSKGKIWIFQCGSTEEKEQWINVLRGCSKDKFQTVSIPLELEEANVDLRRATTVEYNKPSWEESLMEKGNLGEQAPVDHKEAILPCF